MGVWPRSRPESGNMDEPLSDLGLFPRPSRAQRPGNQFQQASRVDVPTKGKIACAIPTILETLMLAFLIRKIPSTPERISFLMNNPLKEKFSVEFSNDTELF